MTRERMSPKRRESSLVYSTKALKAQIEDLKTRLAASEAAREKAVIDAIVAKQNASFERREQLNAFAKVFRKIEGYLPSELKPMLQALIDNMEK